MAQGQEPTAAEHHGTESVTLFLDIVVSIHRKTGQEKKKKKKKQFYFHATKILEFISYCPNPIVLQVHLFCIEGTTLPESYEVFNCIDYSTTHLCTF